MSLVSGIETKAAVIGVAIAVLVLTAHAVAQTADAQSDSERLFRDGRAAMLAGRYEEALSLFEASQRSDPALGTLLNVAVCEEKLGKLVNARAHLEEAHGAAAATDKRRALIAHRMAELDRRMPRLTVRGQSVLGRDVEVTLDGRAVDVRARGEGIAVDPGAHLLACAGKRGETCAHPFRIAEGEHLVQDLQLERPVPTLPTDRTSPTIAVPPPLVVSPAPPPPAPAARGRGRRIATYALAGVGVAGIVASLIAGAGALGEKGDQARHCDQTGCDDLGLQAAARGDRLATIATWSAVVGLASGVGSLYLFATAPAASGGPPGIAVGGTFR
jgi:hypothetical protein